MRGEYTGTVRELTEKKIRLSDTEKVAISQREKLTSWTGAGWVLARRQSETKSLFIKNCTKTRRILSNWRQWENHESLLPKWTSRGNGS